MWIDILTFKASGHFVDFHTLTTSSFLLGNNKYDEYIVTYTASELNSSAGRVTDDTTLHTIDCVMKIKFKHTHNEKDGVGDMCSGFLKMGNPSNFYCAIVVYAMPMCSSVCLSQVCSAETAKRSITQTTLHDSPEV